MIINLYSMLFVSAFIVLQQIGLNVNQFNLINQYAIYLHLFLGKKQRFLLGAIKVHNQTIIKRRYFFCYYLHSNYVRETQKKSETKGKKN